MRAPIFYDYNNTGYYVDPGSTSNLNRLNVAGYDTASSATIDLTGYDQSTYYPVGIALPANRTIQIKVNVGLNSSSAPSWSTHPAGFTLVMDWENNGGGWGTTNQQRKINAFTYSWTNGAIPCGGISQNNQASMEFVYLRGGGRYHIQVIGADTSINAYTSGYDYGGTAHNPTTSIVIDVFSSANGSGIGVAQVIASTLKAYSNAYSPIYYDYNDTAYYVDANSGSRMNGITADSLYSYGNVTAYSDERLKKDWENLPSNFVEELSKVKSGTYTRVDSGERQVGIGAQSLQLILKEAVSDKEQYLGVNYGNAALVSAVELAKEVVNLKAQINQQQLELEELKTLVKSLLANR
jgi:hypothetical protein